MGLVGHGEMPYGPKVYSKRVRLSSSPTDSLSQRGRLEDLANSARRVAHQHVMLVFRVGRPHRETARIAREEDHCTSAAQSVTIQGMPIMKYIPKTILHGKLSRLEGQCGCRRCQCSTIIGVMNGTLERESQWERPPKSGPYLGLMQVEGI